MNNSLERLVSKFFKELNTKHIDYCVLRGYDKLPEYTRYDIDISIREKDFKSVFSLLENSVNDTKWIIFSTMKRTKFYRVLLFNKNFPNLFLPIDFIMDFSVKGLEYLDLEELLSNKTLYKDFFIPTPHYEVYISFLGKALVGKIDEWDDKKINNLKILIDTNEKSFQELVSQKFNKNITLDILSFINKKEHVDSKFLEKQLVKELMTTQNIFKTYTKSLKYFKDALIGKLKRRSSMELSGGFFLVLLGPDGSGKTTLSDNIIKQLTPLFSGVDYYHGRFKLFPDLGKLLGILKKNRNQSSKNIDRNDLERRTVSNKRGIVNILYYGFEYIIAKLFVYLKLRKNRLVVCDRYFYDYLLHPEYKNVSNTLIINFSKLVAQPDLVLLVKCDAEIIFDRKKELTLEEISRQQNLLNKFNNEIKNTEFVDSSKKLEETVDDAVNIIFNYINKDSDFKSKELK